MQETIIRLEITLGLSPYQAATVASDSTLTEVVEVLIAPTVPSERFIELAAAEGYPGLSAEEAIDVLEGIVRERSAR